MESDSDGSSVRREKIPKVTVNPLDEDVVAAVFEADQTIKFIAMIRGCPVNRERNGAIVVSPRFRDDYMPRTGNNKGNQNCKGQGHTTLVIQGMTFEKMALMIKVELNL